MAIMQYVSGMSPARKLAASAAGGAAMLTVAGFVTGAWPYIMYIAIAIACAVVLIFAFRFFLKWRQKGKSAPFIGRLLGTTTGSPATADPAMRAKLDDLRKKFEDGIDKYKSAGKDVYTLPWVLLAGPSGSGKTEAIRNCSVGFPPGLQDPLQGTGGTHNMNWWFMNPAVILDTAGRMFMEEGGGEWRELMKLLKAWRPLQPINGMVLAIGVDSLIKDSAEKIEIEAAKVARQLDAISRDLDVRFPVYIWITKCDLLIGFREFFSTISDPQLQHQILGWSNPADLDEPFQPDRVTEHLDQVTKRLVRRRGGLLSDPTPQNMQSVNPRRIDEVDAMYALPESLMAISSRLRRYLELIFVQGEWSSKPLFLRGIYFTSALQEGAELDEAIARAMGVPVDALPGGSTFTSNKKSYFLRDVLMSKVFPEKGLVTRATNVKQQQRGRKLALLGSAIGVVVLCLAFTVLGYYQLAGTVSQPAEFWSKVDEDLAKPGSEYALVRESSPGEVEINTQQNMTSEWGTPLQLITMTADRTRKENAIRPPTVFKALSAFLPESLDEKVGRAHSSVTDLGLVRPLVKASRHKMASADSIDWAAGDNAASKVLASLVQIERAAPTGKRPDRVYFPVDSYFRLTTSADEFKKLSDQDFTRLTDAVERAADSTDQWPPAGMIGSTSTASIASAAAAFNAHWPTRLEKDSRVGTLVSLQKSLEEFDAADRALAVLAKQYETAAPADQAQYDEFRKQWDIRYTDLSRSWLKIEQAVTNVSVKDIDQSVAKAGDALTRSIDELYRLVLGMSAADSALLKAGEAAAAAGTDGKSDSKVDDKKLADLAGSAADALRFAGDPENLRPILQGMYDRWQELKQSNGPVASALGQLRSFYGVGGRGAVLLAETGDPAIRYVVAARFDAYKQVNEIFTAPVPTIAWGAPKSDKAMSLSDSIDAVETDLNARRTVIDQRSKLAIEPGTPDAPAALKRSAESAAKVAAMGRRTQALDAALGLRSGADPQWVRARVEAVAGELLLAPPSTDPGAMRPAPAEINLPAPISPKTFKLDRGFDPAGAKRVLDDGAVVIRLVGLGTPDAKASAAATPAIIDPRARTGPALEATEATRAYARRYFGDWVNKPVEAIMGVNEKTWAEYRRALDTAVASNPGSIASDLESFGSLVQQALRAIPVEYEADLKDPAGQTRQNWLTALAADNDSNITNARRASIQQWLKLPDNPRGALSQLSVLSASDLVRDYFTEFAGSGGKVTMATPAARYWDQIRLEALGTIVQEIKQGLGDLFDSLEGLRQLPLAMEPPAAWKDEAAQVAGMDPKRVSLIEQNLVALSGAAPSRPADRNSRMISTGDTTRIDAIDQLLKRLFSGNKIMEDPRSARLIQAWQSWLPLMVESTEPIRASIYILKESATNIPAGSDPSKSKNMAGTVRWFNIVAGGKAGEKMLNSTSAGDTGIRLGSEFPLTTSDVRIEFFDLEDASARKVTGARKLVSGWSVMELLSDPDVRPWGDGAGGKRWMVPVWFNGTSGGTPGTYYMWMGIELSKPLPSTSTWPGPAMWGTK
jgi:hypothetical protein